MPALTPKQRAAVERQAADGSAAREFLDRSARSCSQCGQGSSIFNERKEQIIREAIEWFESPRVNSDSHVAVRYIAGLVEIVKLQRALEYRVRKADDAKLTLYGGDQTAG
ncbi:MAG: hypothetical protein ACRDZ4_10940 [Egibacteraceae bacterium]